MSGFRYLRFMSTSLYQKYRPQTFSQMVGQEHVRTTILNEIKSNTVSHAYLFSGPRGVGKTTTARLLARAVNFPETAEDAVLGEDAPGREILDGGALDIIEIDAASHTGVDNVRENIIEHARVAPVSLKRKVFIIDEVHMLSTSAFNALLKTLEEPPKHVMFILATTEIHKVPSTIVSRCERFTFRSIGFEAMLERLRSLADKEGRRVDEDVLKMIAKRSGGALRDAESLLGQVFSLEGEHITREVAELVLPYSDTQEIVGLWQELLRKQAAQGITRVNRLLNDGVDLQQFTKDLVEFLRKVLLYRVQETLAPLQYLDLSQEDMESVTSQAQEVSPMHMTRMIGVIMRAQELSQTATIPQLPLELAIVTISDGGKPSASVQPSKDTGDSDDSGNGGGTPVATTPASDDGELQYEPLSDEELAAEESANAEAAENPEGEEPVNAAKTQQVAQPEPAQAQSAKSAEQSAPQAAPVQAAASVDQPPADAIQTHTQMAAPQQTTPAATPAPAQTAQQPEQPASQQTAATDQSEKATPEQTAKQSEASEQPAAPVAAGGLSMASVTEHWNAILEAVNTENHALHVSLKVGQLVSVENGTLTLGFEYEFYKDRLSDGGNAQVIEQVVEKHFGTPVRLEVVVSKEYSAPTGEFTNIEQPSEEEVANIWDLAAASNFRPQEG